MVIKIQHHHCNCVYQYEILQTQGHLVIVDPLTHVRKANTFFSITFFSNVLKGFEPDQK